jgi:hypothetical protein
MSGGLLRRRMPAWVNRTFWRTSRTQDITMKLHQLRLDYITEHDRLLLRISTDDGKEVLLWLTRRCVRLLWPLLVDMAQSSPRIALQGSPEARAALLGFEHEQALRARGFLASL